jgi:hypothetical protein
LNPSPDWAIQFEQGGARTGTRTNIPFSGWKKKDFARWLRANYPRPDSALKDTCWRFEFRFHHPEDGNVVFEFTARGVDYDACLGDLAAEMAIYAEEPLMNWEIFIRPQ